MVNLFEQWNDMDFVSTYEPIDWKALNDFANRARQDAKDNADARAEKLKNLNEMYVTDINDDFTSEANDYIKSEIERISSLGTNMAPGDFSRDLNKNMSPVLAYQKGAQKQADERRKSAMNLNLDQRQIQAIDEATNLYQNGRMSGNEANGFHYLETVDSGVADYVDKSKSDRIDNGITSNETYSPNHWAEDVAVISADSDIMHGARLKSVLMLNDLGRNGEKSKYYELLKDHVVLNDDGTIKTTAKGTAILKDNFTGTGQFSPYMFKPKAKGNKFVADEENPISFGNGIDALAREYIFGLGYNRTFGKTDVQLPKDGSKGSGKKNPSYDMSKTWTENANDNMRSGISAFSGDSGHYEYDDSKLILMNLVDQNGDKTPYYIYDENSGELVLGSPEYLKQGGAAKKMWYDKETTDEDRFKILIAGNNDTSNGKYNPDNMGEWRFKTNGRSSVADASVIDRDAYESAGVTFEPTSTTKKQGDTDYSVTRNAKSLKIKSVNPGTFIVAETTPILNSKGVRGDETAVVIDKETGDVSFQAGSGVLRNDNMAFNTLFLNRLAHRAADGGHMKATSEYVSSKFDRYENGSLGVSYTATPKDMLEVLVEMRHSNPTNKDDVFAKNQAIAILDSIARDGRYDYEKLPKVLKSCVDSDIVFNSKNRDTSGITFYASIPVSKTVDDRIDETASAITSKNSKKPEDLAKAHTGAD